MRRSNRYYDTEEWGYDSRNRNRCDCCQDWEPCQSERSRSGSQRKESAQFVNKGSQQVIQIISNPQEPVPVEIGKAIVLDGRAIQLKDDTTIALERGRYLVSYYVTIFNRSQDADDHDTFNARLKLNEKILDYTRSRVRLDEDREDESVGNLSKTNLIEVDCPSTLQLVINVTDVIKKPADANYRIFDASIVVEKLD